MADLHFNISDALLRRVAAIHNYPIHDHEEEMIFFGIRGALPPESCDDLSYDFSPYMEFKNEHTLRLVKVNYYFPRCVLGQWLPAQKKVAVFPGSTVPNLLVVRSNNYTLTQFNQLVPGWYDYKKGMHPASRKKGQHKAFRMQNSAVLRRNSYKISGDLPVISYAPEDARILVMNPYDNIHAARHNPKSTRAKKSPNLFHYVLTSRYSSLGCQVLVGNPAAMLSAGYNGNWNAWDKFYKSAYRKNAAEQEAFKYLLFTSEEGYDIAQDNASGNRNLVLNYGSQGETVQQIQESLKKKRSGKTGKPYYTSSIDQQFGPGMAKAIINFQKENYNQSLEEISLSQADIDCFISSGTGALLGITDWPKR